MYIHTSLSKRLAWHEQQAVLSSIADAVNDHHKTLGAAQYHRWIVRGKTGAVYKRVRATKYRDR